MTDIALDTRRIHDLRRQIEAAENTRRPDGIIDLLAEDAVLMPPDAPVQEGRAACAAFVTDVITSVLAPFDRLISYVSDEIQVFGDHAFDRGSYAFTCAPLEGGATSRGTGRYLFLYTRAGNDTWQLARAIVNLDSPPETGAAPHLSLVALLVHEYDPAIEFFVNVLGFELVEDSPSMTNDGRPKRWVVVRPPGGQAGILLARADGEDQRAQVGRQFAGRVGLFLRVDDFAAAFARLVAAGVTITSGPRDEPYGRVVVFQDLAGNKWDLVGPAPEN